MKHLIFLAVLAVLMGGCVPVAAEPAPAVTPSATVEFKPSVSTSLAGGATVVPTETLAAPADVILTLENPHAVLRVGQTAALRLDEGYRWTITLADEKVLKALEGGQGGWHLFVGAGNGSTTLTVQGDPLCRTAKPPCMAPSRLVEFEILVD
jgi:hypothetical protein